MAELLGREPMGSFEVVVRDASGDPLVIRNDPLLEDGTPMPTRFWLVGREARVAVDRLEAAGGVREAESAIDPSELADAHARYAAERDAEVPVGWQGARPSGGVGGTRQGVKCLHAHYAWHLAGGDDPVGRWVESRLAGPPAAGPAGLAGAVAAIDCGTNSTRLLVAGPDGTPVERLMRITRLGEGVDEHHRLAEPALARTVAVLRDYRAVMDRNRVGRVRITATSAVRDASNRDAFYGAAEHAVGAQVELLSGDDEGRLSFAGATAGIDAATGPWLVADIGGGSTELAFGGDPGGTPSVVRSLDVGCVRITERFLVSDPPAPDELRAARRFVADLLGGLSADHPSVHAAATLVGLAGTVAALAAIEQRLDHYDRDRVHHHVLARSTVEAVLETLAAEPASERRKRPGVEAERADVIVGGTLVLAELMSHFGFETCLTSESDILDGLVMSLLPGCAPGGAV